MFVHFEVSWSTCLHSHNTIREGTFNCTAKNQKEKHLFCSSLSWNNDETMTCDQIKKKSHGHWLNLLFTTTNLRNYGPPHDRWTKNWRRKKSKANSWNGTVPRAQNTRPFNQLSRLNHQLVVRLFGCSNLPM